MYAGFAHRVSEANSYFEKEYGNINTTQAATSLQSSSPSYINPLNVQTAASNVTHPSNPPSQFVSDTDTSQTPQIRCCPLNKAWYNSGHNERVRTQLRTDFQPTGTGLTPDDT